MIRKVFTTLAKVPCYIIIAYIISNIILFSIFYFRALGISYVVMQTAVENNYIPNNEALTINKTLEKFNSITNGGNPNNQYGTKDEFKIPVANQFAMFIDTSNTLEPKQMYYNGVGINEKGITTESVNNRVQYGNNITVGVGYCYTAMLPFANGSIKEYTSNFTTTPIIISYEVPALRYYPDK